MKAFLLISLLTLHLLADAQQNNKVAIRYFMQSETAVTAKIPYGNNPAAGHYVQSGDAKIYYEVYGNGRPVVVLHGGIVGSGYEMGQFIDSLSPQYQVIVMATRGHGRSEMGIVEPSYDQKANDVNAVLEKVTSSKVIVLGFSDGAYTGYFFAGKYPEKISRLIAIGAGEWVKGARSFNLTSKSFFAMDEKYWQQQMTIRPEPKRIDEWFTSLSKYYSTLEVGQSVFEQVKCPVLVVAGEKDANAPLETVIKAYRMLPRAQLAIIPNAPHPAFVINFPAVWASMLPFLK